MLDTELIPAAEADSEWLMVVLHGLGDSMEGYRWLPGALRIPALNTLLVNAPDGSWYCNDDSNGLNPMVSWSSPRSGQYDIWIGTYGSGSGMASATLTISELGN